MRSRLDLNVISNGAAIVSKTQVWDEYKYLFHYTTQSGLEGILNSQCLHATHYAYLNDLAEIIALQPRLVEFAVQSAKETLETLARTSPKIKKKIEIDGGINEIAKREGSVLVDKLYRLTFGGEVQRAATEPFIISFCAHDENAYEFKHGLLIQWRAYGKNIGYAIVFDAKNLGNFFSNKALLIGHREDTFLMWFMTGKRINFLPNSLNC